MLLAFLYWIAEGKSMLCVPLSSDEGLVLPLPPISWMASRALPAHDETPEPDGDPGDDYDVDDLDYDESDDAQDEPVDDG
jgi:hypothetical protein